MDNIETVIYHPSNHHYEGADYDKLNALKSFGWEVQSKGEYRYRAGRAHHIGDEYVLVRDLTQPHLNEKKELEKQFEDAEQLITDPPDGPDFLTGAFFFLFFIIPGIIYCYLRDKKHQEGIDKNKNIVAKMEQLVRQAWAL